LPSSRAVAAEAAVVAPAVVAAREAATATKTLTVAFHLPGRWNATLPSVLSQC
jgi:hypothetical protein